MSKERLLFIYKKLKNGSSTRDDFMEPGDEKLLGIIDVKVKEDEQKVKDLFIEHVLFKDDIDIEEFAKKYRDVIVFGRVENKEYEAIEKVHEWLNWLDDLQEIETEAHIEQVETEGYVKTINGERYIVTNHAQQRAKQRGISEKKMLHAAVNGEPYYKQKNTNGILRSDGDTVAVLMRDKSGGYSIVTTYPDNRRKTSSFPRRTM